MRPLRESTLTGVHAHQCGRVSFGMLKNYGCGHVWSHVRDVKKSLPADHMCPECGLGPWYEEVKCHV